MISLGLGAYGRSFKLADVDQNGYLASAAERPPVLLTPEPGWYTQNAGILSYYEICDRLEIILVPMSAMFHADLTCIIGLRLLLSSLSISDILFL